MFSLFKEGSEDSTDHTSIRVGSLVGLNYEMFLIIVRMIHSDLKNFGFSQVLQMMMASSGARWWRNRVYMEFFANLHLIVNGVDKGVVESHIPQHIQRVASVRSGRRAWHYQRNLHSSGRSGITADSVQNRCYAEYCTESCLFTSLAKVSQRLSSLQMKTEEIIDTLCYFLIVFIS